MIEAFATIGALALVFGALFLVYFGLKRIVRPAPAEAARVTLQEMAEWMPTVSTPPADTDHLPGLER